MDEVPDSSVHLVVTSPPYWNLKDYGNNDAIGQSHVSYEDYLSAICEVFGECVRKLTPDGKLIINIMPILLSGKSTRFGRRVTKTVLTDLEGFFNSLGNMYFHSLYIWDKRKAVRFSSWGSYPYPPNMLSTYPYEWIIVFSKEGRRQKVDAQIKEASVISHEEFTNWVQDSIWDFQPASAKKEGHPAPFPEELPRRCIRLYSFVGDTVLDPFAGSGTTLRVARQLGRNSIGYEINPDYEATIRRKLTHDLDGDDTVEFRLQTTQS
ncbi:MAG: DNA-methyltransferase [Candidatus Thorarchaeota archaeon]|nr:MAG: site-specific DNA-methyltransferase [Candidatus Thorarchaeota archaeon]RLI59402.1 MAG: site-specific DNA-methyltransferase [Candidatus Thorarchaeota archaeon]